MCTSSVRNGVPYTKYVTYWPKEDSQLQKRLYRGLQLGHALSERLGRRRYQSGSLETYLGRR